MNTSRKAATPTRPELLRERGEDEVGVEIRDVGVALRARERPAAQPGTAEAAVADRVERLNGLIAGAVRVGPRIEPRVDALADPADRCVGEGGAAGEQREAGGDEERPPRGDVEHREEDPEVEERAAQVVRLDDDQHRGAEEEEQGPEVLEPPLREHLTLLPEVGGEEDDEEDLRELSRAGMRVGRCRPRAARRSPCAR